MASIPTNLHETTFVTVREATERLPVQAECIRDWIREGVIPGVKLGRTYLIPTKAIDIVLRFGTDVIREQLLYGAEDRARAGEPDLEADVQEAAARARARLVVAKARLRQAQRKDLAMLEAEPPPTPNTPADPLAEIRELDPLRIALTVRELGAKPVNAMTDSEIFELIRRLKMATAIPAGEAKLGDGATCTMPAQSKPFVLSLEPRNDTPATEVPADLPAPPPPPPPPPNWLPPPPPPPDPDRTDSAS